MVTPTKDRGELAPHSEVSKAVPHATGLQMQRESVINELLEAEKGVDDKTLMAAVLRIVKGDAPDISLAAAAKQYDGENKFAAATALRIVLEEQHRYSSRISYVNMELFVPALTLCIAAMHAKDAVSVDKPADSLSKLAEALCNAELVPMLKQLDSAYKILEKNNVDELNDASLNNMLHFSLDLWGKFFDIVCALTDMPNASSSTQPKSENKKTAETSDGRTGQKVKTARHLFSMQVHKKPESAHTDGGSIKGARENLVNALKAMSLEQEDTSVGALTGLPPDSSAIHLQSENKKTAETSYELTEPDQIMKEAAERWQGFEQKVKAARHLFSKQAQQVYDEAGFEGLLDAVPRMLDAAADDMCLMIKGLDETTSIIYEGKDLFVEAKKVLNDQVAMLKIVADRNSLNDEEAHIVHRLAAFERLSESEAAAETALDSELDAAVKEAADVLKQQPENVEMLAAVQEKLRKFTTGGIQIRNEDGA